MNCLRTPERIRREWAEHGIEGIDQPDYDAPHRRGDEADQRHRRGDHPEPPAQEDDQGVRRARHGAPPDRPQRRPQLRGPARVRLLLRRLPEGVQAVDAEDLPAGRLRRRGRGRRRAATPTGSWSTTAAPTGVEATVTHSRRLADEADRRGPDGGGRLRLDRVPGPAAALGDRRPGGRQAPASAPGVDRQRHLRGADRGLDRTDPVRGLRPLRRLRGRPRVPDRVGRRDCRRSTPPGSPGATASSTSASSRGCSPTTRRSCRWPATTARARWCSIRHGQPRGPLVADRRARPPAVRPRARRAGPPAPRRRRARDPDAARRGARRGGGTRASRSRTS